jgi:hypothetical protein
MDRATTSDDADVERQVSPHETDGDVGASQDIPLPDSQEVPQPNSHEVPLPKLEDISHLEDPALLVLKAMTEGGGDQGGPWSPPPPPPQIRKKNRSKKKKM